MPPGNAEDPAQHHPKKSLRAETVESNPRIGAGRGELRFLTFSSQFIKVSSHSRLPTRYITEGGRKVFLVPFLLVVPAGVDRTSDREADKCRPLPPSFRILHTSLNAWNPIEPPGLFITYAIQAMIAYSPAENTSPGPTNIAQVAHRIHLLPYIEPQPPIETRWFTRQYVLSAKQPARKHIFGRELGNITISASEPPPLLYASSTGPPLIEGEYRITFDGSQSDLEHIRRASVKVCPMLRVITHYSSSRMVESPQGSSGARGDPVRSYSDLVTLETHTASDLQWNRVSKRTEVQHVSVTESISSCSEPGAPVFSSLHEGQTSTGWARSQLGTIDDDSGHSSWQTIVTASIKPPLRLLPNFNSDFIAHSYSITTRISLGGINVKPFCLVTPLQVAYPCSRSPMGGTNVENPSPSPVLLGDGEACCSAVTAEVEIDNVC